MTLTLVRNGGCRESGHSGNWHRNGNGHCSHELFDDELDLFLMCGCPGWR
jgi:hypothetical protein